MSISSPLRIVLLALFFTLGLFPASAATLLDPSGLTKFGNMTSNSGLAGIFDNLDTNNGYNTATTGYAGITFSIPTRIDHVDVVSASNGYDASGSTSTITIELYGKNGSIPGTNCSGATLIGTTGAFTDVNSVSTKTIASTNKLMAWDNLCVKGTTGVWFILGAVKTYQVDETTPSSIRELLSSDRTYYIRTDGNDSNDCLADTVEEACLTIQHAWNIISGTVDIGGFSAKIKIGDGTYTTGMNDLNHPSVGGTINIEGNTTTPANVIISEDSDDCIEVSGSVVNVSGMELRNSGGSALHAYRNGVINVGTAMRFGTVSQHHFFADNQGQIIAGYDYTVVGGASVHWFGHTEGYINVIGRTVTFIGTPNFTSNFAYAVRGGVLEVADNTYSGSIIAKRFTIDNGGAIYTNGSDTVLPGNSSGINNSGAYNNTTH